MVVRLVLLRTYYFICCLLIASGNVIPPSNTKTSDQKSNNNATKDSIENTTTEVKEAQSVNLKTVSRSRRSNLNSNFNEQFNINAGENAAFNSAFRYNDQIMRKLLKTHSPNPARSHFFFNLITPLDRRATRYNSWDDHSVMHFGKRSVSEKESDESLTDEKSLYEPDPNISKEDEDSKDIEELGNIKRGTDSWMDHNVMHFGKRDDEVLNGEVSPFAETLDEEKKSEDAWHNMMNFGKKSENPWNDHNTMHFGKKDDPWHSMMSFGKKSENPWNDHNTMHFGKREDPWHSMMSFGKKSENPWNDHNTMHFGKREDPWHSMMSFGKKSENPWNDHNTMHFGKREDPWHSMMSFGKKSENPWNDHNTLHFGKKEDPWHNMMSFGKKSENPWNDHNTMHFGKRDDEFQHNMMSFGKKSENPWNDHNTMHFGKKDDPWHSMMSFGKKSENPWNDHNTMHFGKREDPWHNMMSFGKKSENPWNDYNTMHFGKRDDEFQHNMMSFGKKSENPWNDHNTMHFGKKDDPWHSMMSFGKKSENPWNDHNTMHFGKRDDPWHSMMSFGKRSEAFWNDHNTMHFGKREDPWHSMMSFGKKSLTDQKGNIISRETILTTENNTDDHSETDTDEINNSAPISEMKSMNKRSIHPLESDIKQLKTTKMQYETPTNVKYLVIDDKSSKKDEQNNSEFKAHDQLKSEDQQNFEKKSKLWESHKAINFGKIDPPFDAHNMYITPSLKNRLKQKPKNSFGRNGNFKLTPNTQNKGMNLVGTEKKLLLKKRSVEEIMPAEKNFDNEDETGLQQSGSLNSREEFPEPFLQFGKRSPDDNDATDDKKFVPWDILYLTALEQKRDPWESHNTLHFGKRFDPWDLHNTMHFGKKSDPWNYHNTMHFGKKKDPWENHNTMHFGKRSDPWQSHNTMHFGKRSDPWQLHNTMHFGKKSDPWDAHNTMHFGKRFDPWQSHNTMHFGKKSDPWQSHNTMHFGKKSDPWENHNTLHFGKRDSDEFPDYADYTNNPEFELDLNDPTSILNPIVLSDKNSLTSLENESNMIAKLLRSRMNEDFPEDPTAEDLLFKLLENADKLSKSDLPGVATEQKQEQMSGTESDRNGPRLVEIENVPNRLKSDQPVGRSPDKRYLIPFQGPKSIVYPHAWLVSQIRRSVPSSRQFDLRVAEKKEDPINSYMHFGRR
ncbi:uncharacterized protein [Parasteatoda tepidariorum]|uniref:uncharacterized protein n=1 Tax=Parasteatoda tepidariorum TaxID=114398 RepID=UPI001C72279F|nr:probable cyclin-dependent serine/threonine-protein kinase DDB_G0292550 [Parasteatoda tepidariorum]